MTLPVHFRIRLQLVTGSSLLSAVAENSAAESETTIDMVGREEAVKMFEKMSDGFKGLNTETEYPDTEDLNQGGARFNSKFLS